eukprot:5332034-Prymnesium_polylepis.1
MGYASVLALSAPGKDSESLSRHFEGIAERATGQQDAEGEEEFNAAAFWRAPLPSLPKQQQQPAPALQRVEVRYVANEAEPNDRAKLLHIDDEFKEHLHSTLAVGATAIVEGPVGRRWHVRSEQTNGLLHAFTTTTDTPPVEIRVKPPPAPPAPAERSLTERLRERIAEFEAAFAREHGRPPTPEDGPRLPKEVLQLYHEHTLSLQMSPEQTKQAVARLEAQAKARAEAAAKAAEATQAREAARKAEWEAWEARKEAAWAEAKTEARDQRSDAIAGAGAAGDERALTGAASWVKPDDVAPAALTRE